MPIFSNPFKSKPAPFVPGYRIASEKKVSEVLGAAFDYTTGFDSSKAFCKKALMWTCKEFSPENILFILVCAKYAKSPSKALFDQIYNEFVIGVREANLTSPQKVALKAVFETAVTDPPTIPAMTVFDAAVKNIKALTKNDSFMRLAAAPYSTAFTVTGPEKMAFDDALVCLRGYDVVLI